MERAVVESDRGASEGRRVRRDRVSHPITPIRHRLMTRVREESTRRPQVVSETGFSRRVWGRSRERRGGRRFLGKRGGNDGFAEFIAGVVNRRGLFAEVGSRIFLFVWSGRSEESGWVDDGGVHI